MKELVRDYPEEALEFFYPEILERYGNPVDIDFSMQENKKFSHFDPRRTNDIPVIYTFEGGEKVVLTLIEHWSDKSQFDIYRFAQYILDLLLQRSNRSGFVFCIPGTFPVENESFYPALFFHNKRYRVVLFHIY